MKEEIIITPIIELPTAPISVIQLQGLAKCLYTNDTKTTPKRQKTFFRINEKNKIRENPRHFAP